VKVRVIDSDYWAEVVNFGHKFVHVPEHYDRRVDRPRHAQHGLRAVGHGAAPQAVALLLLVRLVPLVERNFNLVELGPRGTGSSSAALRSPPAKSVL
jgi:hypothetical protein